MMEKTKNYKKFSLLEFNRNLNRKHIDELKESILKNGYFTSNPIVVNEDMEILDGQHRFVALKEMEMEIPYEIIKADYSAIIDMNTLQRRWGMSDYVNYYAEKVHNPNYVRLKRITKEMHTNPTIVLIMCGRGSDGELSKQVRMGQLKLTIDDELKIKVFSENFTSVIKKLNKINFTNKICQAMVNLTKRRGFKWSTMQSKAGRYPTLAYNCRTIAEYEKMLLDLYNYNIKREDQRISY